MCIEYVVMRKKANGATFATLHGQASRSTGPLKKLSKILENLNNNPHDLVKNVAL